MQTLLKVDALNATGQATGPLTVGGPLGPTQDPTPAMALIHQDHSMLGEEEDSLDRQQTMLSDQDGFFDSLAQVKEQYEFPINDSTCVKGKLRENVNFYKAIGASSFIISVIQDGYKLPFIYTPPSVQLHNNRSAIVHSSFVGEAVTELLNSGRIRELNAPPFVINPLSVSVQPCGKKRLILDLRYVNKCLKKFRFKCEDWKIALSYFEKGAHMFSFDLKSGYHHIEIAEEHQTYLGFSWNLQGSQSSRYFVFAVLPFGLSTAPYIFTKCVRPLQMYWRFQGVKIAVFLDDGFVIDNTYESCKVVSSKVKRDLGSAGFVLNDEKSVWEPRQVIVWLGLRWNSVEGCIHITDSRLRKIFEHIEAMSCPQGN